MSRRRPPVPATLVVSLLAALTTWLTTLTWSVFAERSSSYLLPILGGALLVALIGMLLRSARLAAPLVVLAQLFGLALWLNHRWAGDIAPFGWLPTGESVRQCIDVLRASVEAAGEYAAPVPGDITAFAPIMLLAGLATAVLVDFLACGVRRAPLAGLPLLAVYTAPVSILDGGVSWLKFAVAALAFLSLLAADEAQRLTGWGRQLSGSPRVFDTQAGDVSTGAVWGSARKIGLTVTGLAVVAPLLVPTFSGTLFDGPGDGPGDGDPVAISNPMVDLRRDLARGEDVDLLSVTTDADDASYLRVTVLDEFEEESWEPSGRDIPVEQRALGEQLAPPPGLDTEVRRQRTSWSFQASEDFESRWLPVPYPVVLADAPGDWRYDIRTLDFISALDDQTTAGMSYNVEALDINPTAQQLVGAGPAPASVYAPFTELPEEISPDIRALAKEVTDGTTNRFAMAVALQDWFRTEGGFTYSLERSEGNGVDDLENFLGTGPDSREGYCEQFAAAMAVMGRTLGIPSRVAVGFLRPQRTDEDTFVYSSHDLHAWPEMYFEGVGWVMFEPTPGQRSGTAPVYTSGPTPQEEETTGPTDDPSSQVTNRADRELQPGATPEDTGGTGGGGNLVTWLAVAAAALLVALLAVAPRLVRLAGRRRRWAAATTPTALAEASWAELRAAAVDLRVPWDDDVTLRSRARALVRSFANPSDEKVAGTTAEVERGAAADPEATAALDRIVQLLERARFARTMPEGRTRDEAMADVARCVRALEAGATPRQRTRATWLPSSVLSRRKVRREQRAHAEVYAARSGAGIDHAV